ncbi:UNVERIFIED_CONTAM: protein PHOTOPERIOD-INDEPENDENT EARLY FLOWERING 1 [Sesamum radiatum]|uniref:DNA helicase n=1 Tax=Sesamum radiatum TaxID=300843 RepID=A0AAW2TKR0_SESRA
MVWLSKDFESERKWKLAQAKKVAIRASKGMLDQATRGEKRVKVLYKHQLELDEKKKKALDKQLEFLLGQTERYSSMLAENLVNSLLFVNHLTCALSKSNPLFIRKEVTKAIKKHRNQTLVSVQDEDYDLQPGDESVSFMLLAVISFLKMRMLPVLDSVVLWEEDDEHTIEEDEALITKEEREEELAALQNEIDLPLEEILKRYAAQEVDRENSPNKDDNISEATKLNEYNGKEDDVGYATEIEEVTLPAKPGCRCVESNGVLSVSENHGPVVEKYKRRDSLKKLLESEKKQMLHESNDDQEDDDFVLSAGEEKEYDIDDETTLLEEEGLANAESNNTVDEIALLQKESEVPIEELLARYKENCDDDEGVEDGSESSSASGSEEFLGSSEQGNSELKRPDDESNGFQMDICPYPEEDEAECLGKSGEDTQNEDIIADAAAAARSAQPTGNTFSTTKVRTKFPFLLKYPLREYQHIGLDWLVTMYEKRLNGILADEMGLGKTIMTISLLAHLACEKGIWGPHLIVVPTSVMLNWETEFLKWCPAFKILTYFGSAKERRIKRQGWLKPNSFHVCITTYRLVIQDSKVFKRKKWKYLILDEAHLIKNGSHKWQTLLNFNSKRRILLTGYLGGSVTYEDFIASSETQATLASANFFGMISVIMQLRKVCNHPDLFEGRPIVSSFDMSGIDMQLSSFVCSMLASGPFSTVDLCGLGLVFTHLDFSMTSWESEEIQAIATPSSSIVQRVNLANLEENWLGMKHKKMMRSTSIFEDIQKALLDDRLREAKERAAAVAWWNSLRCERKPMYATGLCELVTVKHPVHDIHRQKQNPLSYLYSSKLADIVLSPVERFRKMVDQVESFIWSQALFPLLTPFRPAIVRRQVYFPDRRLIQFDCGKLQELAVLLRRLKSEGHRALIFTQMTKMLDILEAFINLYGYTYMRLDGSTQPEERQTLMQRFNTNPKIFLFILSTRSGGVGINLVGADTVIFYDSDWNPAMDQQAQDRCHRIGQTREVHIYRLISESTIEENILKKANQKRALDDLVIQSGSYNTEFFKKLDPMELFSGTVPRKDVQTEKTSNNTGDTALSSVDLEAALKNAEDEADYMALKKVEEEEAVDNQEFTEEGVGKLEDDELVNEEELKPDCPDCPAEHTALNAKSDEGNVVTGSHPVEEGALAFPYKEDDVDMLADVKQMAAAAAAAGQAILSFENQLRPIDRYAVRFLELWDPIIDKAAIESHTEIEETEWELERIEKLKDDMEAEIDDDEVPLVYESWDADFATEVYKQQVEALAQHQLMEDMEREAQEKEALENGNSDSPRNNTSVAAKPKSKKKTKKAKFKSLKKGALVSKSISVKEESSVEPMKRNVNLLRMMKSRRAEKKSRKLKASELGDMLLYPKYSSKHQNELKDLKICDNGVLDLNVSKQAGAGHEKAFYSHHASETSFHNKTRKAKKKANVWSKDFFPSPDLWSPKEDAVLCSVVHEYGPNWNLASDILYGMTAGGSYRGRFRHPIHCSERFRELIQRYVFSASDATNNDKAVGIGYGKSLLRVTEDNIRVLLGIASELPDHELLLQKHFFAVLSAAWRDQSRSNHRNKALSSQNGFYSSQKLSGSRINHQNPMGKLLGKMEFTNLIQCGKLVAAALSGDSSCQSDDRLPVLNQDELLVARERLDLTLELQEECNEASSLPTVINVSILGPDPPSLKMNAGEDRHFKSAQSQFRTASGTHIDSYYRGESQGFAMGDSRSWTPQLPYLGKHKLPVPDLVKPSKSKLRKTSKDHTDLHCLTTSEVFQPMPLIPADPPSMRFDEFPSCLPEAGILEFDSNCFLDMGSEVTFLDTPGVVPFHFGPDLTSGLDDFSILPEFTDIG